MKKFTIYNLQFTIYFIAIVTLLLVGLLFYKEALAACDPGSSPPRAELLVTSPTLSGKFFTSGKVCIVNVSSSIIAFDISAPPNYDNLKEEFYTKSRKTKNNASSSLSIQNENLYYSSGDLSVSSVSGSGVGLVFVDGNLEFSANILYGKGSISSGVVFVVKGNVYIQEGVTEINGVIISEGRILTAASLGSVCNPNAIHQTLTINGSLISINSSSPISFCRKKTDTRTPAEVINHQAKYLVLLKNIFYDTIQQWSEIVELPNLSVVAIPIPPTVDLKVDNSNGPITINSGQSATLSWATSNTPNNIPQNCIASASPSSATWSGLKSIPGGSETTGPLSGPNTYTYNLKCSNTAGEFTDTVTVNVNPPFDYSLTASSNITVLQGQGGSNTISLNYIAGPAAVVTLTSSISPAAAGVNISLTPLSCTPTCSSALAVTTATTTPAATYTVTITGNGGGITRTTSFTLRVNAPPPTVTTLALSPGDYTYNSANLKSIVNPNGLPTTVWYKWNTSQAGSCASWPNTSSTISIGSDTTAISPNIISTGTVLSPSTTYSFCAGAQSSAGIVYGGKLNFTTSACVSDGSCSAPAPACGQTTTGVDNCGNPCVKTGPVCPPPPPPPYSYPTPAYSYPTPAYTYPTPPSCIDGYLDFDFDNYGAGNFGCYTPGSFQVVSNNSDCYDLNANAQPGQGLYFFSDRGDGSFDYNCDGASSKQSQYDCFASPNSCRTNVNSAHAGFTTTVPECGSSASWINLGRRTWSGNTQGICSASPNSSTSTTCSQTFNCISFSTTGAYCIPYGFQNKTMACN